MSTVETIPKAAVWAALEGLGIPAGEPFNRTMVVHITGDLISYEQADGQTILWRRVVDECPSCHTADGHPHTEYCQYAGLVAVKATDQHDTACQCELCQLDPYVDPA
jgi:hypothetical protein